MSMTRTPGATESMTALQMPMASSFTSKSDRKPMTRRGCGVGAGAAVLQEVRLRARRAEMAERKWRREDSMVQSIPRLAGRIGALGRECVEGSARMIETDAD